MGDNINSKKDLYHVEYNGDNTTLLDIKRRHIKEKQTIYSGQYDIKQYHIDLPITNTVPLWQSQPARSEVERLVYLKNNALRMTMDWVGGGWTSEVDYGKNTKIKYDAPEELKQKTDWNENFDQALADNFGIQLSSGDLPISIQMANYIWMRESSRKFGDIEKPFLESELKGVNFSLDVVGKEVKTYAIGMKYTSLDDGETLVEIGKHFGTITPDQVLPCFIGLAKNIAKNILNWCDPFVPNQNQMDALFRRYYSSPKVCERLCERLSKGETPQHLFENWIHFDRCTYKDAGANIIRVEDSTRPADARNCEECRNWFIGVFPEENPLLGKFEDWTYGADTCVNSNSTQSTTYSTSPIKISSNNIIQKHIRKNLKRRSGSVQYIAIHYTAGGSSRAGSAAACFDIFEQGGASADFAVDDAQIVQFNPDVSKYYCFAVGTPLRGVKANNSNTVSIEICSNLRKGTSSQRPNHTGWSFSNASLENARSLAKHLMKTYNIPIDRVIRHYDVSGKYCPGIIGWNNGYKYDTSGNPTKEKNNSSEWIKFRNSL